VDLHNEKLYVRQQRTPWRANGNTHAHTGIPPEYNDRRLFIPPLTSEAPRTLRRVNYHANSVNANSKGVITRKDVDIMEDTC